MCKRKYEGAREGRRPFRLCLAGLEILELHSVDLMQLQGPVLYWNLSVAKTLRVSQNMLGPYPLKTTQA